MIPDLIVKFLEYVQRFATKEAADAAASKAGDEEEDKDEEMSDVGSISDDDS
jgi:ubiquitin-conjugating enzyme E2 H